MRLIRQACNVVREFRRVYIVLNVAYYGVVGLAMVCIAFNPPLQDKLLKEAVSAFTGESPLAPVGRAYAQGHVLPAIGLTFVVNLVLGSFAVLTLPSLVIPFSGFVVGAVRAILWGLMLSPTSPEMARMMIPHSLTLVIEGQAYILALLAVYVHGKAIFLPRTVGAATWWQGYWRGLKRTARLYLLVTLVLAVAAIYEALEVIYLVPKLTSADTAIQTADVDETATQIEVTVDPRVELMSIIFRLAGNAEYNKCRIPSYDKDIEEHFGPHENHPVVQFAAQLRETRGVSYDAPMSLAIHLADIGELQEKVPFDPHPPGLDGRWRLEEVRDFLEKARQFVKDTEFDEFIEAHRPLYDETAARARDLLGREAHLEWFDDFFGARPGADFRVVLGMVNGAAGSYGARIHLGDREELYCILGVSNCDLRGIPKFHKTVMGTVVHEFCHSYVNPHVYAHALELEEAGKRLFPLVKNRMKRMAYGNWQTMMHESVVRASVVRYITATGGAIQGPVLARILIQQEIDRGFLWMEELSELLGEYEKNRDTYPTFESFFPRIVKFFDAYVQKTGPLASSLRQPAIMRIMDTPLYAYVILLACYRIAETIVMVKVGSFKVKLKRDWTFWLIAILFSLVVLGPLFEHLYSGTRPGHLSRTLGAILFGAAAALRARGHLDLKKGFSPFIEKRDGQKLVETGLYKHIRHPLYLGILSLFVACPLFLASRISWVLTALGSVAILVRIKMEERFLLEHMDGYEEYMSRTWALIPRLF